MAQRDALKSFEKQKQALALALAGWDYQTIADSVGYNSRQAAWKSVKSALKKTIRPMAEEVKRMQLSRLDAMLKAIWPIVMKGDLKAIDRALRIEERRAALLGLDATDRSSIEWRTEVIRLLHDGTIQPVDVIAELGNDLATELFNSAGISLAPDRKAQSEIETNEQ